MKKKAKELKIKGDALLEELKNSSSDLTPYLREKIKNTDQSMNKKRSLLATCFLVSVSLHIFFLAFFMRNPLVLQSRFASLFRKSTPTEGNDCG